jgi:hypothetical protein
MIRLSQDLRRKGAAARSMEDAASRVVDCLYECLKKGEGDESCLALVRCFKTHRLGDLPEKLQEQAMERLAGMPVEDGMRCLVLLASRGDEREWNGRKRSLRHQVIPLPTVEIVEEAPMVAQMIREMGLEVNEVVRPSEFLVERGQREFNVFHVEHAVGSEFVPAQRDFVLAHGIMSVLGLGGPLPSGELFVVVMFSKARISRQTAQLFRTLALSVKLALLPFAGGRVFAE